LADGSGWSWVIPLHDGTDSVGVVIHRDTFNKLKAELGSAESVYRRQLALAPESNEMVTVGTPADETKVWQDYSYVASEFGGPGFRLVGDAAGFIDPFFSTGVHLALLGGLAAAASIISSRKGEVPEDVAVSYYDKVVRRA